MTAEIKNWLVKCTMGNQQRDNKTNKKNKQKLDAFTLTEIDREKRKRGKKNITQSNTRHEIHTNAKQSYRYIYTKMYVNVAKRHCRHSPYSLTQKQPTEPKMVTYLE